MKCIKKNSKAVSNVKNMYFFECVGILITHEIASYAA